MRYKLVLSYLGHKFNGWTQGEIKSDTVCAVLEKALKQIGKQDIQLHGSSRTDIGVHAIKTTAHFDFQRRHRITNELQEDYEPEQMKRMINSLKSSDYVKVLEVHQVPATYNARRDAVERYYMYRILQVHSKEDAAYRHPLLMDRVWFLDTREGQKRLDVAKMREILPHLTSGRMDLSSLCRRAERLKRYHGDEHVVRRINSIEVEELECNSNPEITCSEWNKEIRIHVKAPSFIHNQVRILAGLLMAVGRGDLLPSSIPDLIADKKRHSKVMTAPASGLYLMNVKEKSDLT
ncbi:tRNA pseudouridine synthase A [Acrasis kona]|uniref:tRNA pseudouridine synthase n=1 Tax=Acrasis kona TaxID=1008807 RepID=A0AAW2ZHL0_9EUKA